MNMAKTIHYSPDMVCPYCGNAEFYVRQSYKGTCNYNMRFDMNNKEVENGEMHENAIYKTISKYAYCNDCGKRLFPISELPFEP